jgi:hypothetical protein
MISKNLYQFIVLSIILQLLFSCSKPPTTAEILGKYTAQEINSPFGQTIELKENNNCTICFGLNWCQDYSFTQRNFRLEFSNGNNASLSNAFQFIFTTKHDELNSKFYDGNGDGYDDTDSTIQKYLPVTTEYIYNK